MGLKELRAKLRSAVAGEWIKPEHDADRDKLAGIAEGIGIVGPTGHFGKCAREARPITECYAEKGAELSDQYRKAWKA